MNYKVHNCLIFRHPPDQLKNYDAQLKLDMASVMYVHTKRFIAEINAFFNKFTERREMVMKGIKVATSTQLVSKYPILFFEDY